MSRWSTFSCALPPQVVNFYVSEHNGLCEPRNPGGYACGGWFVPAAPDVPGFEHEIRGRHHFLHGPGATNNVAEYRAAISALDGVFNLGYRGTVVLHGDSQLVVNQVNGAWKCNKPNLQHLLAELKQACRRFERVEVVWVPSAIP
jgi:ribonuclease HI